MLVTRTGGGMGDRGRDWPLYSSLAPEIGYVARPALPRRVLPRKTYGWKLFLSNPDLLADVGRRPSCPRL